MKSIMMTKRMHTACKDAMLCDACVEESLSVLKVQTQETMLSMKRRKKKKLRHEHSSRNHSHQSHHIDQLPLLVSNDGNGQVARLLHRQRRTILGGVLRRQLRTDQLHEGGEFVSQPNYTRLHKHEADDLRCTE